MKKTLCWAALVLFGCAHGRDRDAQPEAAGPREEQRAPPATTPPPKAPQPGPGKPRPAHPPRHDTSQPEDERPAAEEGRPQLSMSPEGLMQPDGPKRLQQALAERGFLDASHQTGELDEATSAALRKFQDAEGLARTGAPDRETVRKLGLSISEVFKK